RWPRDWSSDVCSSDLDLDLGRGDATIGAVGLSAVVTPEHRLARGTMADEDVELVIADAMRGVARGERAAADVAGHAATTATPGRSEERRVGKDGTPQA